MWIECAFNSQDPLDMVQSTKVHEYNLYMCITIQACVKESVHASIHNGSIPVSFRSPAADIQIASSKTQNNQKIKSYCGPKASKRKKENVYMTQMAVNEENNGWFIECLWLYVN